MANTAVGPGLLSSDDFMCHVMIFYAVAVTSQYRFPLLSCFSAMHHDTLQLLFELSRQAQSRSLRKHRTRQKAMLRASERQTPPQSELPHLSPTQRQGADYETRALDLLTQAGLQLLARNLRTRIGEIDLVMRDRRTLVFVEVRARKTPHFGNAAASVGPLKRSRLVRSAACLLPALTQRYWHGDEPPVRFDIVAFDDNQPQWLRHAFTPQDTGRMPHAMR